MGKTRRNVNGEGNIRQRSDGRWEGRAYVITTDGREIRRSVYGTSWDNVHEKLTRLQADTMSGKRIATTSQTVGEYLAYWLSEHARHRVRATTYQSYDILVRLEDVGIRGNSHMMMLEKNSDDVIKFIAGWIQKHKNTFDANATR